MRLSFYYFSKAQNTLSKRKHLSTSQTVTIWSLILEITKKSLKEINRIQKLPTPKYQNNLSSNKNWAFLLSIFKGFKTLRPE